MTLNRPEKKTECSQRTGWWGSSGSYDGCDKMICTGDRDSRGGEDFLFRCGSFGFAKVAGASTKTILKDARGWQTCLLAAEDKDSSDCCRTWSGSCRRCGLARPATLFFNYVRCFWISGSKDRIRARYRYGIPSRTFPKSEPSSCSPAVLSSPLKSERAWAGKSRLS